MVPRHLFLGSAFIEFAYRDEAFPIAAGQTISHPFTVAFQTQLLGIQRNEKVLEIIKLIQSRKYSLAEIAKMYNVAPNSISAIKNKKTWKHLTKNITFN